MNWKDFLDSLGLNGTWWQWRIMRLEDRIRAWRSGAGQQASHVTRKHKFCRACGALLAHDDTTCARCAAKAPSWSAEVVRRSVGLILPQWHPVSTLLLFANVANLIAVAMFFGPGNILQPDGLMLFKMGALDPFFFFQGDYFRLITYGYLHIGVLHIAFNLMTLSQVGPLLEQGLGKARFFVLYSLSLIGGGVADLVIRGPVQMLIAGASGALFGLIGYGVSFGHFYGGPAGRAQRDFCLRWALYGFLFGMMVGADNICHLGGFIVGAVMGYLVDLEQRAGRNWTAAWNGLAWLLLVVTAAAFGWLVLWNVR